MKLEHIKINGKIYSPMPAGVQNHKCRDGIYYPVCKIKKLIFGLWQVDYYDIYYDCNDNQTPNTRIIVHSSKVDEVKYRLK